MEQKKRKGSAVALAAVQPEWKEGWMERRESNKRQTKRTRGKLINKIKHFFLPLREKKCWLLLNGGLLSSSSLHQANGAALFSSLFKERQATNNPIPLIAPQSKRQQSIGVGWLNELISEAAPSFVELAGYEPEAPLPRKNFIHKLTPFVHSSSLGIEIEVEEKKN